MNKIYLILPEESCVAKQLKIALNTLDLHELIHSDRIGINVLNSHLYYYYYCKIRKKKRETKYS